MDTADGSTAHAPTSAGAYGRASLPETIKADGLTVALDWPQRTILMVGSTFSPLVVNAFQERGFAAALANPESALELAERTGPFSFLLLSPLALGPYGGGNLVRELRRFSPSARVVLVGAPGHFEATTLTEVMQAGVGDIVDPYNVAALQTLIGEQLRIAGSRRERVLAVGAHPDDIEAGCIGTLLDHRRRGDRLSLLTLSGGGQDQRIEESVAAADAIGAQLLIGDLPGTAIDAGVETIRLIEDVIRQLDPTVVYIHSSHDNNQDHLAAHTASLRVTRSVPQVLAFQSPSATNEFEPTKFVAIDEVIMRKVELLGKFRSSSEHSHPDAGLVIAGARYWARHLTPRARYAEPFEIVRSVPGPNSAAARPVTVPVPDQRDHLATVLPMPRPATTTTDRAP